MLNSKLKNQNLKLTAVILFFLITAVFATPPRDVYPEEDIKRFRSLTDSLVGSGTAAGQIMYWDSTTSSWLVSDATKLKWTSGTNTLLANTLTVTGTLTAGTFTGMGDVLDDLNTLGAAASDGQFIVATGAGIFQYEAGLTARGSLGLGTVATYAGDQNLETTDTVEFVNILISQPSISNVRIGGFGERALYFRGQTANNAMYVNLFTATGDAGDSNWFRIWGKGTVASQTDSESLIVGYAQTAGANVVWSLATGTGTVLPLILYTGDHTNQLYLDTDGQVGIGKVPTVALDVTGAITVSGAITDGAASSLTTGSTIGNLTLANGSITDSGGAISFGDENLSTTGTLGSGTITLTANSDLIASGTGHITSGSEGFIVGTLTITDGSIDDTDGSIAFGATNFTSVGTIDTGIATIDGAVLGDNHEIKIGVGGLGGALGCDSQIYSDGTDTFIQIESPDTIIPAGKDGYRNPKIKLTYFDVNGNASVFYPVLLMNSNGAAGLTGLGIISHYLYVQDITGTSDGFMLVPDKTAVGGIPNILITYDSTNDIGYIKTTLSGGTTPPIVLDSCSDIRLVDEVRIGSAVAPTDPVSITLPTENLDIVDAGSVAATEQDWIEVKIGGNTGYIRVFAAK